jgi:hypothetical protein
MSNYLWTAAHLNIRYYHQDLHRHVVPVLCVWMATTMCIHTVYDRLFVRSSICAPHACFVYCWPKPHQCSVDDCTIRGFHAKTFHAWPACSWCLANVHSDVAVPTTCAVCVHCSSKTWLCIPTVSLSSPLVPYYNRVWLLWWSVWFLVPQWPPSPWLK